MDVLCPLSPDTGSHIEQLARVGAGEFYFGYISGFSYSSMVLSRRPGKKRNFPGMKSISEMAGKIKSLGLKSHLAVNSTFYPQQFIDEILGDLDTAVEMGIDGFIMADFNLFLEFRKRHPRAYVSASTCLHAMNSSAVQFLGKLGFSRVILPRHLTISEMRKIISCHPHLDFEVFSKNDECPNVDGLCSYFHGVLEKTGLNQNSEKTDTACQFIRPADSGVTTLLKMDYNACGVCDFFALADLPNVSTKISGRNLPFEPLEKDVRFVSSAANILHQASSEKEYKSICMQLHKEIYGKECGEKCYRISV